MSSWSPPTGRLQCWQRTPPLNVIRLDARHQSFPNDHFGGIRWFLSKWCLFKHSFFRSVARCYKNGVNHCDWQLSPVWLNQMGVWLQPDSDHGSEHHHQHNLTAVLSRIFLLHSASGVDWASITFEPVRPADNPAAVALWPSQTERVHTLWVFSDRFNRVALAMSGMPDNMVVTSLDRKDYKLWKRTDHLFTHTLTCSIVFAACACLQVLEDLNDPNYNIILLVGGKENISTCIRILTM